MSVPCCLPVDKFIILLECLLPYTHPTVYPKYIGSGIQTNDKPSKVSSVMTVCRHDFHNSVMSYMLKLGESTICSIFVAWVVFVKVIFSCLNLKLVDGFLPYSMLGEW